MELTADSPTAAPDAYHDKVMEHQQTATRCAAQGVTYVPMVFTVQGGMAPKAEAVLHQLSERVAQHEAVTAAEAFKQIADDISVTLVRAGARATVRRSAQAVGASHQASWPIGLQGCWAAATGNDEGAGGEGADDAEEGACT